MVSKTHRDWLVSSLWKSCQTTRCLKRSDWLLTDHAIQHPTENTHPFYGEREKRRVIVKIFLSVTSSCTASCVESRPRLQDN